MLKLYWRLYLALCGLVATQAAAQNNPNENLSVRAIRATTAVPKIDGILDEAIWAEAESTQKNFTEISPNPNTPSDYRTEVKVVYTNTDLYIGAQMYDTAPDSILRQLSRRDEIWQANTDIFGVSIDAMMTKQTSFNFMVTAAGVQYDADNWDEVWDAVWDSRVKINDKGWVVEMRIPYSQLRFPKAEQQVWGLNFYRSVRRTREESNWAMLDPTMDNEAQLYGKLLGIDNIKPPVRLSFTPYVTGYLKYLPDQDPSTQDVIPTAGAGADMKLGISQNFTLDMALIPDFGDILSDNFELNLSPFEQYFEERRPFFTEGIDLFSRADLFYSRRVGATPTRYDWIKEKVAQDPNLSISNNPEITRLINASKFSGRNKNRWGVGIFNALTAPTRATIVSDDADVAPIKELTEPLTNYNVLVVDKQFGTNSYASLVQTSVLRFGDFTDAMAWGTDFRLVDEKNRYGIIGDGAYSRLWLDTNLFANTLQSGFRYNLNLQKLSGKIRWSIGQNLCSRDFDINDLGFVTATNFITSSASASRLWLKPFGWYNNMRLNAAITHTMLYNPNKFSQLKFRINMNSTFKNFLSAGWDMEYDPLGFYDFYEARNNFQVWAKPQWARVGGWFSSDYRKAFALDGNASYRRFVGGDSTWRNSYVLELRLSPRWRVNDKLNFVWATSILFRPNNIGYAAWDRINNSPVFGSRYRQDLENTLQAQYLFTDLISLSLRARHYWSLVRYDRYYNLGDEGEHLPLAYQQNLDKNFNAFNVDLIFRWRFALGSELNIVWKNAVLGTSSQLRYDYWDNFTNMFASNQRNIISVKALYFLDYFSIANKK